MPRGYWVATTIRSKADWQTCLSAARRGDPDMIFSVGCAYEVGLVNSKGTVVVRKNIRLAIAWFRRGAEMGDSSCQINLGNCLSQGNTRAQDLCEAIRWYKRAFSSGESAAANNLAVIYRNRGNARRAYSWLVRAMQLNDGDATVEVAAALFSGAGVRKNPILAMSLCRKAVRMKFITEAGRDDARFYLGKAYLYGCGVPSSKTEARKWLRKANRDNDHQGASILLKNMEMQ